MRDSGYIGPIKMKLK